MYDELFCEGTTWHSLWARMFTAFSQRGPGAELHAAAALSGRLAEPAVPPDELAHKQLGEAARRMS